MNIRDCEGGQNADRLYSSCFELPETPFQCRCFAKVKYRLTEIMVMARCKVLRIARVLDVL